MKTAAITLIIKWIIKYAFFVILCDNSAVSGRKIQEKMHLDQNRGSGSSCVVLYVELSNLEDMNLVNIMSEKNL